MSDKEKPGNYELTLQEACRSWTQRDVTSIEKPIFCPQLITLTFSVFIVKNTTFCPGESRVTGLGASTHVTELILFWLNTHIQNQNSVSGTCLTCRKC